MLKDMFLRLFFRRLSIGKQADLMKRRGIIIGTRSQTGRMGYLYMLNNLFAEIFFEEDNPQLKPEATVVMNGLQNLSRYLENDLRTRY